MSESDTTDDKPFVYDATKESLWSDAYRRLKRDKLAIGGTQGDYRQYYDDSKSKIQAAFRELEAFAASGTV